MQCDKIITSSRTTEEKEQILLA